MISQFFSRLGFGARLTLTIILLVLCSVSLAAGLVYWQYRSSYIESEISRLEALGGSSAQTFVAWLNTRQDEMRFLASLEAARQGDRAALEHLLERTAASQGYYDTIFVVSPQGRGVVGVGFENGRARVLSQAQAEAFNVADREWFRQAIAGRDTFSRPVVSRSSGNLVSTVAVPIRVGNEVVAVMRGAVQLDTIFERVDGLALGGGAEIYLLDRDGRPVTPVASAASDRPLTTEAGLAIAAGRSGAGRYRNAAGVPVVGSYTDIPLLDWGLVLEVPEAEALAAVRTLFWRVVLLTVVILVLAVLASLVTVRSVVRTLGGDPAYAAGLVRRVAEGDLTVEVALREGDRTSLLAAIGDMQRRLGAMIAGTRQSAMQVASAAAQLKQINEITDRGVQRQTSQVNDAATAMNEMTATVEEVARNTQSTADATAETRRETEHGKRVVASAIDSIDALAAGVASAATVVGALKADSDRIGEILAVIRAVAEQTNLLALNAAIEAARAGDNGRGFAVVADEVRALAARTQDATGKIESMIEALQGGADQAVGAMEDGRTRALTGVEQVAKAGESLDKIAAAVARIEEMSHQVASATEEQSAAAREINQSIHAVSEVSRENADSVVQTSQASEALAGLAEELKGMVEQFRT